MPEVSSHYRVVVKCFASGQCGPGSQAGAEVGANAYSPPNIGILWYLVCSNFFPSVHLIFNVILLLCAHLHIGCAPWLPGSLHTSITINIVII